MEKSVSRKKLDFLIRVTVSANKSISIKKYVQSSISVSIVEARLQRQENCFNKMLNDSQMAGIWQYFPEKYFLFKICNNCKEAICISKVLNLLVTGGNKKAKYIYQLSAAGFTKYR